MQLQSRSIEKYIDVYYIFQMLMNVQQIMEAANTFVVIYQENMNVLVAMALSRTRQISVNALVCLLLGNIHLCH